MVLKISNDVYKARFQSQGRNIPHKNSLQGYCKERLKAYQSCSRRS